MSNKFLISYLGGSGGDLFCNSCNGIYKKNYKDKISSDNRNTLKNIENKKNNFYKLLSNLKSINHRYITTHLFEEFLDKDIPLINLIFKKTAIKEKIILRQMQIQRLRLKVSNNEDVFDLIRGLCTNKNYNKAAKLYFEFSKKIWLDKHQIKVIKKNKTFKTLYFDDIFTDNFCESIRQQHWNENLGVLKVNHISWLKKNNVNNFTYHNTIDSMAYKFRQMPWDKEDGWIEYQSPIKLK